LADAGAGRPLAHLAGFAGVLQVDGYSDYRALAGGNQVTLAFCWAHVRRRFYGLAVAGAAPIASEALTRIAELYRIESDSGRSAGLRSGAEIGRLPVQMLVAIGRRPCTRWSRPASSMRLIRGLAGRRAGTAARTSVQTA
jgi:hypothetical protein